MRPQFSIVCSVLALGAGGYTIWAPREVSSQSGEFESVPMNHVEAFTNP